MVGWFVGLYIAEGSHGSDRTIQIAGHVKEAKRYKRLREPGRGIPRRLPRSTRRNGNAATINLTGPVVLDAILGSYVGGRDGQGPSTCVPHAWWQRSNTFLRAVLDGYLSGDGHLGARSAHRLVLGFTDNDALAADLRALGVPGSVLSVRLSRCTAPFYRWFGGMARPMAREHHRPAAPRPAKPDSQIVRHPLAVPRPPVLGYRR